jgi:hypothetical protein
MSRRRYVNDEYAEPVGFETAASGKFVFPFGFCT